MISASKNKLKVSAFCRVYVTQVALLTLKMLPAVLNILVANSMK